MTVLLPANIAWFAKNAGFTGGNLVTAVAVAMGESGGKTEAHNDDANTGDDSYGLWQINMLGSMGPARRKAFGLKSNAELLDPAKNAKAAYAISNQGRNFTPWSVYKSGAYREHLGAATAAAAAPVAPSGTSGASGTAGGVGPTLGGVPVVSDIVGGITALARAAQSVASGTASVGKLSEQALKLFIPSNAMRLGMGIAGFIFIFVGIALLGHQVKG